MRTRRSPSWRTRSNPRASIEIKRKAFVARCAKSSRNTAEKCRTQWRNYVGLPGVGRKTANVVLGNAFHIDEGIVVDTHVIRLSQRLGLTKHKDHGED